MGSKVKKVASAKKAIEIPKQIFEYTGSFNKFRSKKSIKTFLKNKE